jgi:hypothetical protein
MRPLRPKNELNQIVTDSLPALPALPAEKEPSHAFCSQDEQVIENVGNGNEAPSGSATPLAAPCVGTSHSTGLETGAAGDHGKLGSPSYLAVASAEGRPTAPADLLLQLGKSLNWPHIAAPGDDDRVLVDRGEEAWRDCASRGAPEDINAVLLALRAHGAPNKTRPSAATTVGNGNEVPEKPAAPFASPSAQPEQKPPGTKIGTAGDHREGSGRNNALLRQPGNVNCCLLCGDAACRGWGCTEVGTPATPQAPKGQSQTRANDHPNLQQHQQVQGPASACGTTTISPPPLRAQSATDAPSSLRAHATSVGPCQQKGPEPAEQSFSGDQSRAGGHPNLQQSQQAQGPANTCGTTATSQLPLRAQSAIDAPSSLRAHATSAEPCQQEGPPDPLGPCTASPGASAPVQSTHEHRPGEVPEGEAARPAAKTEGPASPEKAPDPPPPIGSGRKGRKARAGAEKPTERRGAVGALVTPAGAKRPLYGLPRRLRRGSAPRR